MRKKKRKEINERKEKSSSKMTRLNIPDKKIEKYIKEAYCFSGRTFSLHNQLESKLDFLIGENSTSEEAVSTIDEMLETYRINHMPNHPWGFPNFY